MINHRLLKAIIKGETATRPQDEIALQMAERRRLNRMAERDVGDWLYARYLSPQAGTDTRYAAEIIDISRAECAFAVDNGAVAFIPAPFLHAVRDELVCSRKTVPCRSKARPSTKLPTSSTSRLPKSGWKPARHRASVRLIAVFSGSVIGAAYFLPRGLILSRFSSFS